MNTGHFLDIIAGVPKRIYAILHSTGAPDADKLIRLDSQGRLSDTVMPVGIVADTEAVAASETLAANDLVQIFDSGSGIPAARKADATAINKFQAVGFVKDNFNVAETALVYFEGRITGLSGLTPGLNHYLSETPGQSTTIAPSTPEAIVQRIGQAVSATTISFERAVPVELQDA